MKRLLPIFVLLLSSPLFATTWYATSSSANINATGLWVPTTTGSCTGSGTALVWGAQANGDVFDANGCTALAVNVDPGVATGASAGVCGTVTVTTTLETDSTNGGAFTYATATNIVIHANITATKTTALAISGSTGGGTICGNILGGSTASQYGVSDGHTVVTFYEVGNITGGSAGRGYVSSVAGPIAVTGNITGGSGVGNVEGLLVNSNGIVTVAGNCQGGTASGGSESDPGCATGGSSTITLTGNVVNTLGGSGTAGRILFTPSSTNYIISPKDSSYTTGVINSHATVMPTDPGASNVLSGVNYGPYTGTATSNGVSTAGSW